MTINMGEPKIASTLGRGQMCVTIIKFFISRISFCWLDNLAFRVKLTHSTKPVAPKIQSKNELNLRIKTKSGSFLM